MATTSRATTAALESDLIANGHQFSFFQAMHLLQLLMNDGGRENRPSRLRIRPELSLAFPAAEVAGVEKASYGYLMTVTFLGLYGPDTPLPTFYTEQLLEELLSDHSVRRDFLDTVNQRVYQLLYQGLLKYRLTPTGEGEREHDLEPLYWLYCLMGLGEASLRRDLDDSGALLPYAGLLGMRTRSALGLSTLLQGVLEVPVRVVQCLERRVPIPPDQVLRLGSRGATLGDALLGEEVPTRTDRFRVLLGPLDRQGFEAFLPGAARRRRLEELVSVYVKVPLTWELEIILAEGEAPAAAPGCVSGGMLGWDSWLAPDAACSVSACFTSKERH
jgi:type VI secretion system protein ImpH